MISKVVETMSDKDLRQIENQIMPQRREKEATRAFWGMIIYVKRV